MKRRHFIQTTASATTALMLASLESFAKPQSIKNMKQGFQLKILATNWGFDGTIDEYCAKVKKD
ncbi:MAG: sugar phosphate isomerase/epimerase, partial [Parafilimonas sp.]